MLQVRDIVREGPQQPGGMAGAEPRVREGTAQPRASAAWGAVLWAASGVVVHKKLNSQQCAHTAAAAP